ncbi:SDR family NAD(P)-dependent oxidoreductase [Kocuria aegyptia]|uniref:SDR family NAD(P)-dependent oxidoreductase n=1 Tax=Kocuria aegyptia TaxID=330943 RepID=A0ABN2KQ07_9MICC
MPHSSEASPTDPISRAILLTRAALPGLRASGDAVVVNVSSELGLLGMAFCATYGATRAGIAHFGEGLSRELYGEGVHVLNVFPGATGTPMTDSSEAQAEHGFNYESPEEVAAATVAAMIGAEIIVVRGQPMGQMLTRNREDPAAVGQMLAAGQDALDRRPRPTTPASEPHPTEKPRPRQDSQRR